MNDPQTLLNASTVYLKGVGAHEAVPADKLRAGNMIVSDYGNMVVVLDVKPYSHDRMMDILCEDIETRERYRLNLRANQLMAVLGLRIWNIQENKYHRMKD